MSLRFAFIVLLFLVTACAPAATPVPPSTIVPAQPSAVTFAPVSPSGTTAGGWEKIIATNAGPSARYDHTLTLDPAKNRAIVFGGRGANGTTGDTWIFDLATRAWKEIKSNPAPAARHGHAAIYDAPRRRMVIFSGQASGFFNDVWAFDLEKETWQELAPSGDKPGERPVVRYGASAVFDSTLNRMIISHGFAAGRFDDTWAFDLAKNAWTNITPSGDKPLKRCLHEAVYDTANDRMLLYGGCSSGFGPCPQGDLWSLDLKTNQWTEIKSATIPGARSNPALVYDGARNRLLLQGGLESGGATNDAWAFDLVKSAWTKLASGALSARRSHDAVVDEKNSRLILFGGTGANVSDELWEWRF